MSPAKPRAPLFSRSPGIPVLGATIVSISALSLALYTLNTYGKLPARADSTAPAPASAPKSSSVEAEQPAVGDGQAPQSTEVNRPASALASAGHSPYVPLGWGSNRYLTLQPDPANLFLKKPVPLSQFGATPLRDLVVAEKYGAAIDARGDCWMWGAGYDPSGLIGRSLRGKKLTKLAPAPGKIVALSSNGRLYAFSASKAFQDHRLDRSERGWWSWLFGGDAGSDFVELKAEGGLKRGEKWTGVSAGGHHVLALTNKGRTFSIPLSPSGNSHRQLGTRQVFDTPIPVPSSSSSPSSSPSPSSPAAGSGSLSSVSDVVPALSPELPPESDPRFATTLTEIPALKGTAIAQVSASDRTSFTRTPGGRVLGFGANESGQIGLGTNTAVETVPLPVEVVLARNYPGGTAVECLDVTAAGQTTFFTVKRDAPGKPASIDLLACGNGISGALGNGLWSSAAGVPARVKTVSGLTEFSEENQSLLPLGIHHISISPSPSPHVFAVLDTVAHADAPGVQAGRYGMDVMVWGGNGDYQLGNAKRSSLAVPQHLPMLIQRPSQGVDGKRESEMSSGTRSPMPHSRLQLHTSKTDAYDLDGHLIRRGVKCEETVVAGWNASVLYNKIID